MDRRLFNLVWQELLVRFAFLICLFFVSLGAAAVVLQAFLLSRIVQRVFLDNQSLIQVSQLMIWLLECILGRFLISLAKDYFADRYTDTCKTQLRERVLFTLHNLGPFALAQERLGELVNTIVEGIEALDPYFREWLPQLWSAIITPILIIVIVLFYDPLSALIFAVTAPLIPFFMVLIGKAVSGLTQKQWNALSRMSAIYLELLQGLTSLKIFNRSIQQAKLIKNVGEEHENATMKVLRVAFLSALSLELLSTISTAVVAVGVGLRLLYGYINFENALFVLFLAPELYLPLRQLGLKFHSAIGGVSAANRIFDVLAKPSPIIQGNIVPSEPLERICFRQVSFSYSNAQQTGVRDISIEVHQRQLIALVGPSGAGKSTLMALLLGFIRPSQGEIVYNNIPFSRLDMEWWRSKVSWLPQNPYLFNDTVMENIRIAAPQADIKEVIEAAQLAHAHGFIQALPQGYETVIGERGIRLSMGEAQRLALARAFLKKDSFLLIVDEPTAVLDVESEQFIQEALLRLAQDKTVMIIAHRLRTVYKADQILVLSRGKLVQRGTHEELIAEEGVYRQLVRAPSYREGEILKSTYSLMEDNDSRAEEKITLTTIPLPLIIDDQEQPVETAWEHSTEVVGNLSRWYAVLPFFRRLSELKIRQLQEFIHLHIELILPIGLSIIVGSLTILSGISLMGAAAFIISAAALQPSIAELNVAIVGVRFFGISRAVLRYIERLISHKASLKLLTRLRVWFYTVLELLVPARLQLKRSADMYETINADITSLDQFYLRAFFPPLVAVVVVAMVSVYFMGTASPLNAVFWAAACLAGIITPLGMYFISRRTGRSIIKQRRELTASAIDFLQGLAELLIFQRGSQWLDKLKTIQQIWAQAQSKMAWLTALQFGLTNLWANLALWAALFILIPLVNQQVISGVLLAVLLMILLSSFEAIVPLPQAAQFLEANQEAAGRLLEIARTSPLVVDAEQPKVIAPLQELSFQNVTFRYSEQEPNVLQDISFKLSAGKKIAIVGHSGAGKSSLVNLLLRFWEVQEGELLWNGVPLRCYRQEDVRNEIAVLNQRFALFNMSIRDHFRLANPQAEEEEIRRVCEAVKIHQLIVNLPNGYDTMVGERGSFLSAGEKQRLGLAMVLLRPASMLVLDEPTAHLDTLTEISVITSLEPLINNKAVLWITHRLVGLERMDEIIVMKKGRIIERGKQHELLAKGGEFSRMLELQNQYTGG